MSNESYAQRRADNSEHQSGLLSSTSSRSRLINAQQDQQPRREHLLNNYHQSVSSQPSKLLSKQNLRLKRRYNRVHNSSVDGCLYLIGGQLTPTINKSSSSSSLVRVGSHGSHQIRRPYRSSRTPSSKSEALSYCQNSASRRRAQQRVEQLSGGASDRSLLQQRPVRLTSRWRPTGARSQQGRHSCSVSHETINIDNCHNDDQQFNDNDQDDDDQDDQDDREDFYDAKMVSSLSASSSHKSPICATGTGRRRLVTSASMTPVPRSGRVPPSSTSPSTSSLSSGFSSSNTNLDYYNSNATNNGNSSMQQLHRGQYSSSQAHLQSLTMNYGSNSHINLHNISLSSHKNSSNTNNANSSNSLRKPIAATATTTTPTSSLNTQTTGLRHHFSSQQQLFPTTNAAQTGGLSSGACLNTISASVQNNNTKPMTSMLHNESSTAPSSPACFVGPSLPVTARHPSPMQQHNHNQHHHFGSVPFVVPASGAPSLQANYMRPPVAQHHQFIHHQHHGQLPPPYSSVVAHVSGNNEQQHQHTSSVANQQQQQMATNANSSLQHQSSTILAATQAQPQAQVRSIFNFSAGHQQQAFTVPSNNASPESMQATSAAAQHEQASASAGAHQTNIAATGGHQLLPWAGANQASPTSGNYQLLNGRAQLVAGGNFTKSKSCLACADISIKWYIVVIALLGLICALIGTIVGAVHSVGRDYISLSLLLLGVGLVLVAISWIALRITINTYKSSANESVVALNPNPHGNSASRRLPLGRTSNGNGANNLHHQQQQQRLNRPHGHRNHHQLLINQHQQAIINERFYMMAAAAAAAAATAASSSANSTAQRPVGSYNMAPSSRSLPRAGCSSQSDSLLSSIKQRIPRFLGRLISNNSTSDTSADRTQTSIVSQQSGDPSSQVQASTANALAALVHQYQMLPIHHQASLLFAPNGLAPPLPPPPIHFFAAAAATGSPNMVAPHLHDAIFRPPPPSYTAAMQDQRIRMIMQERASLQQLQQNSTGVPMIMPNTLPPPPPPSTSGSSTDQISSIGNDQEQPMRNSDAQPVESILADSNINCPKQNGAEIRRNNSREHQTSGSAASAPDSAPIAQRESVNISNVGRIDCSDREVRGDQRRPEIDYFGYL